MTLLTRRMTGRVAARAGAVAFAKAVATAGGLAPSEASAAGTPALGHNAAARSASPASANQASSCQIYQKGHSVAFSAYGGGTLTMLGDCHGNIASKIASNQPGGQGDTLTSGGSATCTASLHGSQYSCKTAFVPNPYSDAKSFLADSGSGNFAGAEIRDYHGQFIYTPG